MNVNVSLILASLVLAAPDRVRCGVLQEAAELVLDLGLRGIPAPRRRQIQTLRHALHRGLRHLHYEPLRPRRHLQVPRLPPLSQPRQFILLTSSDTPLLLPGRFLLSLSLSLSLSLLLEIIVDADGWLTFKFFLSGRYHGFASKARRLSYHNDDNSSFS